MPSHNGLAREGIEAGTYSSDQPIQFKADDRFNRWPFASRIADTLANRKDPSSLVIGLYGPWGDGKTSTLRLMEETLASHAHITIVRFNPWHFESEQRLLLGFFATLAEALGKSLPTKREEIGRLFQRYGSLLSLASVTVGGIVQVSAGEAAKGLGEALSSVELDERRARIEKLLAESGRRVVVLIDDIDRLDRTETQAILKLVKLSASFDHTSYVLAFDDDMVAAALGERYGEGGVAAGRSFLEKIVQVPLHLPPADQIELRKLALTGVDAALSTSDITLSEDQVQAFGRHFVDGLEPRLATPRHAKLYGNALVFALPLLKGEAHPVDLMLIEGIRIFYPKLYALIRDNPEEFLEARDRNNRDQDRQRLRERIDGALDGTGILDKEAVRRGLLEVLFPRIGNTGYGPEWDTRWAREQRICSQEYFQRYFTYSVPPGDIADGDVARLVQGLGDGTIGGADADAQIKAFAERRAIAKLIGKLRSQEEIMELVSVRPLALAIARNGAQVPRERGAMLMTDMTFRQAAILVAQLLKRLPAGAERDTFAVEVVAMAQPLPFAWECFRWVRKSNDEGEDARIVSAEAEEHLGAALAERIHTAAIEVPLYKSFDTDAPPLYWLWSKYRPIAEIADHLRVRFEAVGEEVDEFLASYVGMAWEMETGLARRSDFRREGYNNIALLIDPDIVMTKLKERYGVELDAPQYHPASEVSFPRRVAHQFAFIHQKVHEEPKQPETAADS